MQSIEGTNKVFQYENMVQERLKRALQEKVAKAWRSSLGQRERRISDSFGNGQPRTWYKF